MSAAHPLDPFFSPRSVAVVGASNDPASVGHAVMYNLLYGGTDNPASSEGRARGFAGPIYPVNHKGGEVLGLTAVKSVRDIEGELDLVVVAIPGKYIPAVIDDAGAKGVKSAIIISAGFAELGEEGHAQQEAMVEKARGYGMRLIGPNCLGVQRPSSKLNASFGAGGPTDGRVGLLSQSGALITGIISYAEREAFGLSCSVSLGDKADVTDLEVLDWLRTDDNTKSVALYVEGFPRPRETFDALAALAKDKPVVALKGGRSAAGAKAASSHTGALAGSAAAYSAAFAQAGVIQAGTISDFLNWSRTLADQPPARGNRIAIVTNAGGPGVLSADEAERQGLVMATLSDETIARLNEVLPHVWSHGNPVDVIGDATAERYKAALDIIGQAPEVDGIVVIMTVQAMTAPDDIARAIAAAHENPSWEKPLVASFIGLVGTETGTYLDARGVPELNTPEEAVRAMRALVERGRYVYRGAEPAPVVLKRHPAPDLEAAGAALEDARRLGQTNLDLSLARAVLESAGLRYNQSGAAKNADEAVRVAEGIGYPVVLKAISPDILHKSDMGAVILDVADADGVREACAKIESNVAKKQPGARITGFTVEEQVSGTEIIVGVSRDPGFGPLLMVGMGGIFVEVYKDVSFRLLPLSRTDAHRMIDEIKAQPLLNGARERPRLDRDELAEVLQRVSALVERFDDIKELDLNPLVITETGLVAIDARVIL